MDGKIHIGMNNYGAGRAGDPPAARLSARLKELKLAQGRLKTGTPPRLDGRTIDFSRCLEQPGDGMPGGMGARLPVFSFMGRAEQHPQQVHQRQMLMRPIRENKEHKVEQWVQWLNN